MPITDILEQNAALYGNDTALVELNPSVIEPRRPNYYRREITWKVFNEKANRFAHFLMSRGVKKGDKVGILLMNCIEWLPIYFGILKVGPALTYAMREAIFALSMIEKELLPEEKQAHVMESLEQVMLESPGNWMKHYHGTEQECRLARKYSFSDRTRYYIGDSRVQDAIAKLFANLRSCKVPMNMIHQYMPLQFDAVRKGALSRDPQELAEDAVRQVLSDYEYAAGF